MSHAKHGLIALAALLAAACSDGGGSAGSPPTSSVSLAREDYALQLAEWLCDDLAACCDATQEPVDRDACLAVTREAQLRRVASEEERSGRAFDGGMAAECVALLQETPADCGYHRRVHECFKTYDGRLEIGQECAGKTQCRGSLRGDVACIDGRCAPRLAAGEPCNDEPHATRGCDVCRPDARCREAADGNRYCYAIERRRGVAGDPCRREILLPADPTQVSIIASCEGEDGLYCSSAGVCEPFTALGGPCRFGHECGSGNRCADGICTPGLADGETCDSSFECGAGLYCLWTDFACTDPRPAPLYCTGYDLFEGYCAVPAGAGEPCGEFVECAEGLSCTARGPEEGRCVERSLCTVGLERLTGQSERMSR